MERPFTFIPPRTLAVQSLRMNKLIAAALFVLLSAPVTLAQKDLTNQAIWYSNTFSGDGLSSLISMQDGTHYSTLEAGEAGAEVNAYDYRTGEKTQTHSPARTQ